MHNEWTQKDSDYIADVIWWIKGFAAANNIYEKSTDLNEDHLDSLRKARIILDKKVREVK